MRSLKRIMDNFSIKATAKTPEIMLNSQTGEMLISGRSIPEDADEFWSPILKWFYAYASQPATSTRLVINLEYFNITSSKRILYLLYKMSDMSNNGHTVTVDWIYAEEDEDMYEVGKDFSSLVSIPFNILEQKAILPIAG